MKIATAAYPMDPLQDWAAYREKLTEWVGEAAGQGAELLLFPEYGAMEIAMLDGPGAAADLEGSVQAVSRWLAQVDELHSDLAAKHGVHICAASAPVFDDRVGPRPVNRARLFTPQGGCGLQDKQIMTRFEREEWDVVPGGPLTVFDTALGRIGILICYDCEFPLLARAMSDAELILAPSCTEANAGYSRVRIGAMARALENQCVVVHSPTTGTAAWSPAVDENVGAAAVYGPPDLGFPSDGILAAGTLDTAGWVMADVTLDAIRRVRRDGQVLNHAHWPESETRARQIAHATEIP